MDVYLGVKYLLLLALYGQSFSTGQSKQHVASPAACGFADFRKCFNEPNDDIFTGVAGENQLQIKSMSL